MAKLNLLTSGIRAKFTNPVIGPVKTQGQDPDRGFEECCYINYAFGDTSSDNEKNDIYGGHIFKREEPTDTIAFYLIKNGGDIAFTSSHGTYYDFGDVPNQPELSGVQVEWKKVLANEGEGKYQAKAVINPGPDQSIILSNSFILKQFSWALAHNTVRFDAYHNSCFDKLDIDFTGTRWKDQVRVRGIFGYRQNEIKQITYQDNLLNTEYTEVENVERYTFKSLMIPECIAYQLWDRVFLASDLRVNDYNNNNTSYEYIDFKIVVDKANENKYFDISRMLKQEYVFLAKRSNNRALNC